MKVKVQCPCGTRFEFEVQPVNGRMPVSIACPSCNADATELANEVIRQQSAAPPTGLAIPSAPVLPPASAVPAAPVAAAPPGLRIARSSAAHTAPAPVAASAPVAESADAPDQPAPQFCPKHKSEPAADACVVCGKPTCLRCMEQFGHVCSVYCRQQAEHKRIYVPPYAGQRAAVAQRAGTRSKLTALAVALPIVALLGLWFYYAFFGRNPKVVYSVKLGKAGEAGLADFYMLIAPNRLFCIKSHQASLVDILKDQPIWSTPIKDEPSRKAQDDDEFGFAPPFVSATTNSVWAAFPKRLVKFDLQTGALGETTVKGHLVRVARRDDALVASFIAPDGALTLARVNLNDGDVQTTPLSPPPATKNPASAKASPAGKQAAAGRTFTPGKAPAFSKVPMNAPPPSDDTVGESEVDKGNTVTAQMGSSLQTDVLAVTRGSSTSEPTDYLGDSQEFAFDGGGSRPFTIAGSGVVQLRPVLLEAKTVTHQAMKAAPSKSVLDGNVTASQGIELAQEMINNSQRDMTGGVSVEDVSRYQVTLHRWFAADAADWTGEVTGPPRLYSLKTLDLLVAGQSVTAFDRSNHKLWEAKLSYPMDYAGDRPPVIETADSVYVADPGVLNCFDRASGTARWRLNSVGISSVQAGERGGIYVTTTTAGPEKIKFSQEHNIREKIHPIILKADPATGKVLWRVESIGDGCATSGKFVYSVWANATTSAYHLEDGPDSHFNLNLLKPSNGATIWNYYLPARDIEKVEIQQNWILLRYDNQITVLKFFSL